MGPKNVFSLFKAKNEEKLKKNISFHQVKSKLAHFRGLK